MLPPPTAQPDSPEPGENEARERFIGTFAAQWESLRILVNQIETDGAGGPAPAVVDIATRLSELTRAIGFPTVSARASELAELADAAETGVFEGLRAHVVVDAMMEAFSKDLASAPPVPQAATGAPAPPAPTAPPAPAVAAAAEGDPPVDARVRIAVIADDNPDVTRIVDAQMRAAGYDTILAYDGEETLAAVRANHPDILVLDLMMPKLSGYDVLTELRADPAPRPRTIVLSALAREDALLRAFELGADDYMTKPFNPQELIARISRLLK